MHDLFKREHGYLRENVQCIAVYRDICYLRKYLAIGK